MSDFKEILVCADVSENMAPTLKTALIAARRFCAHINAVHVHQEPSCVLPVPVVTSDMAGFIVNDVVTAEETALAATADKTRKLFESFLERENIRPQTEPVSDANEVTAEYRELYGNASETLAWASLTADLTVLPRPDASSRAEDAFDVMNAVLTESGAAVLVAPSTIPASAGDRVAVVWDASEEAAKAVTFALPFLKKAQEVVLIETASPNPELAGVDFLKKRLKRHGVNATLLTVPETSSVSALGDELIRQTCGRFDLLVMGAYTQSNMRRWILGSTTKYMVEHADIPLFMAH